MLASRGRQVWKEFTARLEQVPCDLWMLTGRRAACPRFSGSPTVEIGDIAGDNMLILPTKCRSRPVSRVRNTVGMGRFPVRLGATTGRKPSGRGDKRRRTVPRARHRTADYVRYVYLTVNCETARRFGHLQEQNLGAERDLCCRGLSSRALPSVAEEHSGNQHGARRQWGDEEGHVMNWTRTGGPRWTGRSGGRGGGHGIVHGHLPAGLAAGAATLHVSPTWPFFRVVVSLAGTQARMYRAVTPDGETVTRMCPALERIVPDM